jgi:hypothetical protein
MIQTLELYVLNAIQVKVIQLSNPFLTINRKMFDELLGEVSNRLKPAMRNLWFYLLYNANWADGRDLQRGQIFVGRKQLADETGLSEQTIKTLLNTLKSAKKSNQQDQKTNQQLTSKPTSKGSVLTIENYDTWVMAKKESNQQSNQQLTSDHKKVTTSEYKDNNKQKKKPYLSANADVNELVDYYQTKINEKVRLTKASDKKIQTRLKNHSVGDLKTAIDRFSGNEWRMQENSDNPLTWFFNSDNDIEKWMLLKQDRGNSNSSGDTDDSLYERFEVSPRRGAAKNLDTPQKPQTPALANGKAKIGSPPSLPKIQQKEIDK